MLPSWKTVRVFISSTFHDMQAERDYLIRFVFPRLREELLKRRIHLVDVDLRWGVTSEQDALEVCKEIIDECRPRFLCMLGGRYGWVPLGKNRSITADEVYYGVLDRALEDRGFAYFYFRDDSATLAMKETTPGQFRETQGSENKKMLADLKEAIVVAGLQPFTYPAQWDNETSRLIGLNKFGERVFNDLLGSLKADPELQDRFVADTAQQPDEFSAENAAMDAFVEERSQHFVLGSREAVLNELLAHASNRGTNGYICLIGAPGSGKSALLAHLSRNLRDPALNIQHPLPALIIQHFVGASPGSTDVHRTLRRLCYELKARCFDITNEIPDDLEKLPVAFLDFLRQSCATNRVVLLIDAINQFDLASRSLGLHWFPKKLPPNCCIILSSLEGPVLEELRRISILREIMLQPLSKKDCEAIIKQFCKRYHKKFEPGQCAALLAKADAGTPLYLLAALEELRTLGHYNEMTQRIAELPPRTRELFVWILKRLENDDGFRDMTGRKIGQNLVSQFASLLGVSRYGLRQRELVILLSTVPADEKYTSSDDTQGNVTALFRLLRFYLMHRGDLLDFYHSEFRNAVEDTYLQKGSKRLDAHRELANYFLCQLNSIKDDIGKGEVQRGAAELLFHLKSAEMWDEIISSLKDPMIFDHLWPGAYGLDFDKGCYTTPDSGALEPNSLSVLPTNLRSDIGYAIAAAFGEHAKRKLQMTKNFEKPLPRTADDLREHDSAGFAVYRDTFYSFIRLAGRAAEFALFAFEDSPVGRAKLKAFREKNGDIGSHLYFLCHFGYEITGLSHALEDDATTSYEAWEKLRHVSTV